MIIRSAKVPLSPSSALQTMYFRAPGVSRTVFHLMPVGKPAPPRPRRPLSVTWATISAGARVTARSKALQPVMGPVVAERQRIDDAAAGKGQTRLAFQERQFLGLPETERMVAARRQSGVEQGGDIGCLDRAIGDPALGPSRPRSSAPASAGRASRCARSWHRCRALRSHLQASWQPVRRRAPARPHPWERKS